VRALVTGGAGFIGSNLVDALLERGDDVLALDDLSQGRRENLEAALAAGAELSVGDVRDADLLAREFGRFNPQLVFHLAAQMDVRKSMADPAYDADVNVIGTLNLLEAARERVERFVFASTGGAIYGEGEGRSLPFAEDAECLPEAPYGQSKLAGEGYCLLYGRLFGLAAACLRLGNVYGPRQDPLGEAGVVAIFCNRLKESGAPTVYGDGRQTRDYIYVGDVVDAMLAAADSDAGGVFNVGTGVETSVLELVEAMGRIAEREGFEPQMAAARQGEIQRIAIDSSRAEREFGWRAQTPLLDEGLRRTIDWAREASTAG
jgi:UDP-glucose 4-epimerase